MAKLAVVARPPKGGSGAPLYIRISHQNSTRYVSLGLIVEPKHWNARVGEVRKTLRDYNKINAFLQDRLSRAQGALVELQTRGEAFSPVELKEAVETAVRSEEKPPEEDYIRYAYGLADDYQRHGKLGTADNHRIVLRKLEAFLKKTQRRTTLPFDDLTPELLRRFQSFLATEYGNSQNTIAKNLKDIRASVYTAIREGKLDQGSNPFFHVKIKEERTRKQALTLEELRRLETLEFKWGRHGGRRPGALRSPLLKEVRDIFVFAVYAQGMRWADVAMLDWKAIRTQPDGSVRLGYTMRKNKKFVEMLLPGPAVQLLDQYRHRKDAGESRIFPALDGESMETKDEVRKALGRKLALYNKSLKSLAKRAEIDTRVTFHIARHSFANIALELGFDVRDLNAALQHGTLRTTEIYIEDLKQSKLDEKMRRFG